MATITAAAGGGNWTSGATWVGGIAPSAADDVLLNGSSGNVTITAGSVARSLDCTGYTGTLTHIASVSLTLGDATAGAGNVALNLVAGMTYTLGNPTTSSISFISTAAAQQTIVTGGKTLGGYTIQGAGSSYLLADANTSTGKVLLNAGTFNTGGQTCIWLGFVAGTSGTKILSLGSSAITITEDGGLGWEMPGVGSSGVTANTATITFTGGTGIFSVYGTNMNGSSLVFSGGSTQLLNGLTVANLTLTGAPFKTGNMLMSGNLTVTGTLNVQGNSAINRIFMYAFQPTVTLTVSAAIATLTNVDFRGIIGAGAAAPLSGTSLGDCGGCSNITFTPAVAQTHTTSPGGNWSDASKWTSRVPLPQDDVFVDANTTGTIVADMPRLGKSISFAGFSGTAAFTATSNTAYGSWTNSSSMTITGGSGLTLSGRAAYSITGAGKTFTQALTIQAPNGTYTLQDTLTTNGTLNITAGTLTTNNQTITCSTLYGLSAGTFNLGSSTVNLTATSGALIIPNGITFNAGTSTIVIASASANTRDFYGQGLTLSTLTYTVAGSTGTLALHGPTLTIGTLHFSDANNARTLSLGSTPITITNAFNVYGTAGKLMTINSITPGVVATLVKTSGVVACDYVSLQDSAATGGASWYAGANSVNVSNNTGWFFQAYSSSKFLELM